MFKRIVKDKIVFVLAKDKETPSNKEDWATIKGEILTETGFKWSPQYQVFTKWDKLPDSVFENLDRIFFKYYVTATPNATQQMMAQVTATPQQEPEIVVNVGDVFRDKNDKETFRIEKINAGPEKLVLFTRSLTSGVLNDSMENLVFRIRNGSWVKVETPQVEIAQSTASPVTTTINDLLKTFKDPKDVTDLDVRKFIIRTLIDRLDKLETHNTDKNFLKNYTGQIFDAIYVPLNGKTYHLTDGIKMNFSPQNALRQTKKDLLLRIMDIAGCWAGADVVFGLYVDVEGDSMSEARKRYAEKIAKENGRDIYLEEYHVGGTITYRDFYSLYNTAKVAMNFLENKYEAELDSHEFTDAFKKVFINERNVEIHDKDYQGNDWVVDANLYIYQIKKDNIYQEYVYILELGSSAEIYSNSFNLGYNMVQKLIKDSGGLVSYLKGVHPFVGEGHKYLPQLLEKFPDLFPKNIESASPTEDKAVIQAQIDELENFLKISGEMDEEDKKVILSQILDLHTLLKLI